MLYLEVREYIAILSPLLRAALVQLSGQTLVNPEFIVQKVIAIVYL